MFSAIAYWCFIQHANDSQQISNWIEFISFGFSKPIHIFRVNEIHCKLILWLAVKQSSTYFGFDIKNDQIYLIPFYSNNQHKIVMKKKWLYLRKYEIDKMFLCSNT